MGRKTILPAGSCAVLLFLSSMLCFSIAVADDTSSFELGNDLLRKEDYQGAMEAYRSFVDENPDHRLVPAAKWTMANILLRIEGDHEKGQELLRAVLEENPDTDWEDFGYYQLSRSFEEREDWEKAAEAYESAVTKLSASEDPVTQQRTEGLRRRLVACYEQAGDDERVIRAYETLLQDNARSPSAPSDQYSLGLAYLNAGNSSGAAENFSSLVERYPSSSYAQRVRSEQSDLLAEQLEYDWTPFSSYHSALELAGAGRYEEALTTLDEVVESTPDSPMASAVAFQKRFIEYQRTGEAASLRQHLESSENAYPYGLAGIDSDRLGYFLGMIVEAQEDLSSGRADVGGSYLQMGIGYLQTQASQCGIDSLSKGIELSPQTPNLYNILGYCNLALQRYDEAISAFQQLIDVAPEDPNSYDSMGEGLLSVGDTTKAIEFYERSLSIDSTFTNPYYMLGTIHQGLRNHESAVRCFETYLEADPAGYRAEEIRGRLEAIRAARPTPPEEE